MLSRDEKTDSMLKTKRICAFFSLAVIGGTLEYILGHKRNAAYKH